MNGRTWTTLLVMAIGAALAATAGEFLPPNSWAASPVRIPWLVASAAYWAVCREAPWGVVAGVWLGAVADALGGTPPGVSPVVLAVMAKLWDKKLRQQMRVGAATTALYGGAAALLCTASGLAARRFAGELPPIPPLALALGVCGAAVAGAPAAAVARLALGALDRLSGNVDDEEEEGLRGHAGEDW